MNEDKTLYSLPKEWKWVTLGEMAKVKGGKRLPQNEQYSEGETPFPYLRVVDFENLSINQTQLKYLTEETQNKIRNYTISSSDLYISIAGTIGKVGTIPESLSGANLTENAAKITEINGFDLRYLAWHLNSHLVQKQISEKTIATTQPKLALYRIEKLNLILPPKGIQQAIVSKIEELFSELDKGIENLRLAQQKLKTYRQAVLKWAFEGRLTNNNINDGLLPDGWVKKILGDVAETCLGKMLDKDKNKGDYHYYLRNISVRWGSFDLNSLEQMRFEKHEEERYGLKKGDLIICEGGEPGRCAIWKDDLPNMKIQKALHRVRVKDTLSVFYLYYFMVYAGKGGFLESLFTGTTIKHLTGIQLKNIQIPIPPIREQYKIVQKIESRLSVADKLEETIAQSLQQAESLRQSILKQAFEGKLV
jgi:type I restriction enzyme S subunit